MEHFRRFVKAGFGHRRLTVLPCFSRLTRFGVGQLIRSRLLTLLEQARVINNLGHLLVLRQRHLISTSILASLDHLRWLDQSLLQLLLAHLQLDLQLRLLDLRPDRIQQRALLLLN